MGDPVPSSAISDATTGGLSVIVITGGSTGQVLTLQANGTYAPSTLSAGDVVGPASSTDNALVRFDATTGKLIQNSVVTVGDTGNIAGVGTVSCGTITATGRIGVNVSPSSALHVKESANNYTGGITLENTNGWMTTLWAGTGALVMDSGSSISSIWLQTSSTTRVDVTSAGISVTGAVISSGLMCCGVYTFATVPSPSSNTGKFLRISDRAQKHAYSDGTNWRFFGDDAVIS
jgi:hypothetical protein